MLKGKDHKETAGFLKKLNATNTFQTVNNIQNISPVIKMKFCTKCDNMYYVSINTNNADQLTYYCRFCGHKDDQMAEEGVCVLKTVFKKNEQQFGHIVNRFTKLDPTLPRIKTLKCPNGECTSAKKTEFPEVIYIRYDDENMKFLYICTECDTTWKQ